MANFGIRKLIQRLMKTSTSDKQEDPSGGEKGEHMKKGKGISALKAGKPKGGKKASKGKATVARASSGKGVDGLKMAKNGPRKGGEPKTKQEIAHSKRAVKLAKYKF